MDDSISWRNNFAGRKMFATFARGFQDAENSATQELSPNRTQHFNH
jgi:hypothetical protein